MSSYNDVSSYWNREDLSCVTVLVLTKPGIAAGIGVSSIGHVDRRPKAVVLLLSLDGPALPSRRVAVPHQASKPLAAELLLLHA